MTLHNITTQAHAANRDLAAAAERDAVVFFVRRQADLMANDDANAADVLRALAVCIEAGDHRR